MTIKKEKIIEFFILFCMILYFFVLSFSGLSASDFSENSYGYGYGYGYNEEKNFWEEEDFSLDFQRPSYVEEISKNIYRCDENKEECKINFNITQNDKNLSSRYNCHIDFGDTLSFPDEKNRCNPRTIIIPEGKHVIKFQIFHTDTPQEISSKSITIENLLSSGEENAQQQGNKTLPNIPLFSEKFVHIPLPEPHIEIQSGLEKIGEKYNCKKEDCKVNLTAKNSFSESFLEKNYSCVWDFGGGAFTTKDTDKKCNPGYVTYGLGTYEISLKIFHEDDSGNFSQQKIIFENRSGITDEEDHPEEKKDENNSPDEEGEEKIPIRPYLRIGIQGRQAKYKTRPFHNKIICHGVNICSVNFTGADSINIPDDANFYWSFGNGNTSKKLNPKSQKFQTGKYRVLFRINDVKKYFYIEVEGKSINTDEKEEEKEGISDILPHEETKKELIITLQGKMAKHKTLFAKNSLLCEGVSECSVNLTGENSKGIKKGEKFFWDFGNGETSEEMNPGGKKFPTGKYEIIFQVGEEKQYFFVEVKETLEPRPPPENIPGETEKHTEKSEKILKNNFYIRSTQYKNFLKIYGKAEPNTELEIFFGEKIFLVKTDEEGKFFHKIKILPTGEYTLFASQKISETPMIFEKSTVSISSQYAAELLRRNTPKAKKASKKKVSTSKITKKKASVKIYDNSQETFIGNKGGIELLLVMLLSIFSVLGLYILLRVYEQKNQSG